MLKSVCKVVIDTDIKVKRHCCRSLYMGGISGSPVGWLPAAYTDVFRDLRIRILM
jgi:hypothetical protein